MSKVTVIIPALNEAGNVGPLVHEVLSMPETCAIVVDNGSVDATAEQAKAAGARVVSEPRRGYGYACAAGAESAEETDIIVFLDADGSFRPEEMDRLTGPILSNVADMVLGSRFQGLIKAGAMPLHQRWGNRLIAGMLNSLHRTRVSDIGPYRAIRGNLLRELHMSEMTFAWPVEMIIKAKWQGARILEVPVTYGHRLGGRSKVSGTLGGTVRAGTRLVWFTLRSAVVGQAVAMR